MLLCYELYVVKASDLNGRTVKESTEPCNNLVHYGPIAHTRIVPIERRRK
jgi:hypothetical protein